MKAARASSSEIELPKELPSSLYYQLDAIIRNADVQPDVGIISKQGMELRRLPVAEDKWEYRVKEPRRQDIEGTHNQLRKGGRHPLRF